MRLPEPLRHTLKSLTWGILAPPMTLLFARAPHMYAPTTILNHSLSCTPARVRCIHPITSDGV